MRGSVPEALLRSLQSPAAAHHAIPLRDGGRCPHCDGAKVQKWGRFSGRQRFRCTHCRRTFSTFTGTALHYLKRIDRWPAFLWCVDARLTVRLAAMVTNVHKDTSFRWRHRLLDHWRRRDRTVLRSRVAVGEFRYLESQKGSRSLTRQPRRRQVRWLSSAPRRQWVRVLVARERDDAMIMEVIGCRDLRPRDYDQLLLPRFRDVAEVVGFRGPRCPLAAFARRAGAEYCPDPRSVSFLPDDLRPVWRRLNDWLQPFRGVATRYLPNYLQWFRTWLGSRPAHQQFPRTECYGVGRRRMVGAGTRLSDRPS